jgi:hypothetical protein
MLALISAFSACSAVNDPAQAFPQAVCPYLFSAGFHFI